MTGAVRTIEVAAGEAGSRVDRWFRRHFPELGHAHLQKLLRTGQVRVDGGRAAAGDRLEAGQRVRVPPLGSAPASPPRPPVATPPRADEADRLRASILHMDDDVIVIDKPAGLAVQGGTGTRRHLDGWLDALRFGRSERPRLVHRLDRDTSGVLVLARGAAAAARLAEAFRAKEARKLYWAIVVGVPKPAAGRIELPLAKLPGRAGERMAPDPELGKRAVTLYRIVERAGRRAAWLALEPVTGRTHQLRVHAAAIGTPILGDGKYGGAAAFLESPGIGRGLHLHARALRIGHPAGGTLEVAAPLPPALASTWRFLGFDPDRADAGFVDAPSR